MWTGVENLACTGIRSPERPARSESLYRLRNPGLHKREILQLFTENVAKRNIPLQFLLVTASPSMRTAYAPVITFLVNGSKVSVTNR